MKREILGIAVIYGLHKMDLLATTSDYPLVTIEKVSSQANKL